MYRISQSSPRLNVDRSKELLHALSALSPAFSLLPLARGYWWRVWSRRPRRARLLRAPPSLPSVVVCRQLFAVGHNNSIKERSKILALFPLRVQRCFLYVEVDVAQVERVMLSIQMMTAFGKIRYHGVRVVLRGF